MVISQEEFDKTKQIQVNNHNSVGDKSLPTNLDNAYGFVPSSSVEGVYYLISKEENNLICSCPARVECKHLKDIKNGKATCLRISRPL